MLSGRRLDILNPSPLDVEIEDIAHGLARVARWNGQTRGGVIFSVAQHSVLVAEILGLLDPAAPARWRLFALLHDAPEYVIGDMISPFKAALGDGLSRGRGSAGPRHPATFFAHARSPVGARAHDQAGRSHLGLFRGDALRRIRRSTRPKPCSARRKSSFGGWRTGSRPCSRNRRRRCSSKNSGPMRKGFR